MTEQNDRNRERVDVGDEIATQNDLGEHLDEKNGRKNVSENVALISEKVKRVFEIVKVSPVLSATLLFPSAALLIAGLKSETADIIVSMGLIYLIRRKIMENYDEFENTKDLLGNGLTDEVEEAIRAYMDTQDMHYSPWIQGHIRRRIIKLAAANTGHLDEVSKLLKQIKDKPAEPQKNQSLSFGD